METTGNFARFSKLKLLNHSNLDTLIMKTVRGEITKGAMAASPCDHVGLVHAPFSQGSYFQSRCAQGSCRALAEFARDKLDKHSIHAVRAFRPWLGVPPPAGKDNQE